MENLLLERIVTSKDEIDRLNPLNESKFAFIKSRWENLSNQKAWSYAHEFQKTEISRKDVIEAYQEYYAGKIDSGLKAFLYTLIWGFTASGYGPHRTNKILESENVIELFENALQFIKQNESLTAFNALMSIKGLKISYVSKVMYFASKALAGKTKETFLIFDTRVAQNLVLLGTCVDFSCMFKIVPDNTYEAYCRYDSLMNSLADKLGVDADKLEMFLFKLKSDEMRNEYVESGK
jgi:hypothetical protein